MLYDIEERTEDAFVAYLQINVGGDVKVYHAFSDEKIQYPCVVVGVRTNDQISEDAEYTDVRQLHTDVAIITEAAPEQDDDGGTIRTARERNALLRSDVVKALRTSLKANLIAAAGPGVAFSGAQMIGPITRDVDEGKRAFMTIIPVYVIAEPVEVA